MTRTFSILILSSIFFSIQAQTLDNLNFGTDEALEIATWNIEWFPKNGQTTVDYVSEIIKNLDLDVYAIQEIDDTTVFKTMIDDLDDFDYILMDGWFGGLVYVYNTDRIEVLDAFEIYTSSTFWNPLPRSPLVLKFKHLGETVYAINNHFKCCGDGTLNLGNTGDEENRRLVASTLIEEYISQSLNDVRVILLGDLNDVIDEPAINNVFTPFLNEPDKYTFADMELAQGPIAGWSYPSWPSHIDHIMITNELASDFLDESTVVESIDIASHLSGGWSTYDSDISDHRPVVMRITPSQLGSIEISEGIQESPLLGIYDLLGRECSYAPGRILLYKYLDGSVVKRFSLNLGHE